MIHGQCYLTPRQLKRAMERQWKRDGVSDPLQPARWRVDNGLTANHDPRVPDEDEGDPLSTE
jgi:secreted protein with Ig-like and vWFA domain